jgi:hypothetical protein
MCAGVAHTHCRLVARMVMLHGNTNHVHLLPMCMVIKLPMPRHVLIWEGYGWERAVDTLGASSHVLGILACCHLVREIVDYTKKEG